MKGAEVSGVLRRAVLCAAQVERLSQEPTPEGGARHTDTRGAQGRGRADGSEEDSSAACAPTGCRAAQATGSWSGTRTGTCTTTTRCGASGARVVVVMVGARLRLHLGARHAARASHLVCGRAGAGRQQVEHHRGGAGDAAGERACGGAAGGWGERGMAIQPAWGTRGVHGRARGTAPTLHIRHASGAPHLGATSLCTCQSAWLCCSPAHTRYHQAPPRHPHSRAFPSPPHSPSWTRTTTPWSCPCAPLCGTPWRSSCCTTARPSK